MFISFLMISSIVLQDKSKRLKSSKILTHRNGMRWVLLHHHICVHWLFPIINIPWMTLYHALQAEPVVANLCFWYRIIWMTDGLSDFMSVWGWVPSSDSRAPVITSSQSLTVIDKAYNDFIITSAMCDDVQYNLQVLQSYFTPTYICNAVIQFIFQPTDWIRPYTNTKVDHLTHRIVKHSKYSSMFWFMQPLHACMITVRCTVCTTLVFISACTCIIGL